MGLEVCEAPGASPPRKFFLHNIPPLDEPVKGARKDNVSNDDEGQHGNMIILCLCWRVLGNICKAKKMKKMKPSLPAGEKMLEMVTLPYMGCLAKLLMIHNIMKLCLASKLFSSVSIDGD